jgi:hypothetical protein
MNLQAEKNSYKNKKFTHNLLQGSLSHLCHIGGTKPTTITQISAFPFAQSV